jgi:hypothetical protein
MSAVMRDEHRKACAAVERDQLRENARASSRVCTGPCAAAARACCRM